MKLTKLSLMIVVALVAMIALTVSANAFSNDDLATYITTTHMISGSQYKLTDANAVAAKEYLMSHPVSDAQAAQIKSLLDQALSMVSGKDALSKLTQAEKTQIMSLLQQAGNIAGVTVSFNTQTNTITVSANGTVIISGTFVNDGNGGVTIKYTNNGGSSSAAAGTASNGGAKKFVYTGADNSVFAVIALLAVVAVSTVVVKKAYAK